MNRPHIVTAPALPAAFAWAQILFLVAGLALLLFAPASWRASGWVIPAMLAFNGAQWAIWPQSSGVSHPVRIRWLGIALVVAAAFLFIQFVQE